MSCWSTIFEITPLLPWRPASLSPSEILRFLATNTRTRSLTPGGRSSPASRLNVLTSITTPPSPWGTFSEVSRTSRAFSLKIARISFSSAVSSVSPFGVTLPTSRSPEIDLGADADDAAVVEVAQRLLRAVGDVAGDLLLAELRRAGVDLVLLDVDRGQLVVLHEALGEDDRVLEVVALPGHEGDHQVLAERHLAAVGRGAVGQHVAGLDLLAGADERLLVDQRALVGAHELLQLVLLLLAVAAGDHDPVGVDVVDGPGRLRRAARRRCRAPRGAPCRCRPAARRSSAAAPPGAACSSPSGRGWRRRARGTGSSPSRPTRSARARRRSGRRLSGRPSRTGRPACGTGSRRP